MADQEHENIDKSVEQPEKIDKQIYQVFYNGDDLL